MKNILNLTEEERINFIRMKFIEALRSGEYKQTTGKLRKGNCFCA